MCRAFGPQTLRVSKKQKTADAVSRAGGQSERLLNEQLFDETGYFVTSAFEAVSTSLSPSFLQVAVTVADFGALQISSWNFFATSLSAKCYVVFLPSFSTAKTVAHSVAVFRQHFAQQAFPLRVISLPLLSANAGAAMKPRRATMVRRMFFMVGIGIVGLDFPAHRTGGRAAFESIRRTSAAPHGAWPRLCRNCRTVARMLLSAAGRREAVPRRHLRDGPADVKSLTSFY
jgi:hypothetical protein